jgi:hypothetical protein
MSNRPEEPSHGRYPDSNKIDLAQQNAKDRFNKQKQIEANWAKKDKKEKKDKKKQSDDETEDEEVDVAELMMELKRERRKVSPKHTNINEARKLKQEMNSIKKEMTILKEENSRLNLLNAKLLYSNKIFTAKDLTESKKNSVLKAFEKGTSVKEVKLIYEMLKENLTTTTKSFIKENLGSASKAIPTTTKQPIMPVDDAIRRMQEIAGIR